MTTIDVENRTPSVGKQPAEPAPSIQLAEQHDSENCGLTGPTTTLQVTTGALIALAAILALTAGNPMVGLSALGVTGLVPLTMGAITRGSGRRRQGMAAVTERAEDAAILTPAATLCWLPVVLITDLRDAIFHGGPLTIAAGPTTDRDRQADASRRR